MQQTNFKKKKRKKEAISGRDCFVLSKSTNQEKIKDQMGNSSAHYIITCCHIALSTSLPSIDADHLLQNNTAQYFREGRHPELDNSCSNNLHELKQARETIFLYDWVNCAFDLFFFSNKSTSCFSSKIEAKGFSLFLYNTEKKP